MIEDDARLAQMVSEYLGQNGLAVTHWPTPPAAWNACSPAIRPSCPTW
jgi:DNA-binding response OmpR family regulator